MKKLILSALIALACFPSPVSAQGDGCGVPTLLAASKNLNWTWYAYVKVYNDTPCPAVIGLPVFEAIDGSRQLTQDNQRLFAESVATVNPGDVLELYTPIPVCGEYQYDPNHGMGSVGQLGSPPNFGQGEHLYDISAFGGYYGGGRCYPSEEEPPPPPLPPPPPPPPVEPPVPPQPVCPAITPDTVRNYISDYSVEVTEQGARSEFTISLPDGCWMELHLASYVKRGCERFPQDYIDGLWGWFPNGRHTFYRDVWRTETLFQVDLRLGGLWFYEDFTLTQEREDEYYAARTLAWRSDWTGCQP